MDHVYDSPHIRRTHYPLTNYVYAVVHVRLYILPLNMTKISCDRVYVVFRTECLANDILGGGHPPGELIGVPADRLRGLDWAIIEVLDGGDLGDV